MYHYKPVGFNKCVVGIHCKQTDLIHVENVTPNAILAQNGGSTYASKFTINTIFGGVLLFS